MVLARSLCRRAACRLSAWATLVSLLASSLLAALAQAQHTSAIVSLLSGPWDEPDPFDPADAVTTDAFILTEADAVTDAPTDADAPNDLADGDPDPRAVSYGAILDNGYDAALTPGFGTLGEALDGDTAQQLRDELPRRRLARPAAPGHPSHGRIRARRPALDRR